MRVPCTVVAAFLVVVAASNPAIAAYQHGSLIAFSRFSGGNFNVRSLDLSTNKTRPITTDGQSDDAEYSPNGKKIVFSSKRGADVTRQIYVARADGSNAHELTSGAVSRGWPSWSPDGSQIVYIQTSPAGYYRVSASGGASTLIYSTAGSSAAGPPTWSPNGARIAFSMNHGALTLSDVYSVLINGTGLTDLTQATGNEEFGDYSPSGSKMIYTALVGPDRQVFVMNSDGSHQTQLTTSTRSKWWPRYTANGNHVVYSRSATISAVALFSIKTDGTNEKRLTPDVLNRSDWFDVD